MLKEKLAAAHQIIAFLEMDDLTYTHISHRFDDGENFLISPFGLLFEEVTSNNLVKMSFDGVIADDSDFDTINQTGFTIHSSIYKARPEINAIIHLHTNYSIAVSAMKCGLLPLSQHALHFYKNLAYHDYDALFLDKPKSLIEDLSDKNVLILKNHGFVTCGKTIEEALFYAYHLERACAIQTMILPNDYILPSPEACEQAFNELMAFEENLGERDWNAWMRKLDK